jgi:hypothetical protein
MWICSRSTLSDAVAKWQPFVSSFRSLCFFYVEKFVIYVHYVGGRTLFLTGEALRFPTGHAKCEVFNEADPGTLSFDV